MSNKILFLPNRFVIPSSLKIISNILITWCQAIGAFEFEFQNDVGDELTGRLFSCHGLSWIPPFLICLKVTENKTPAAPPAGFVAIEPSSFKVALGVSKGKGLTLAKIDYIFDAASRFCLFLHLHAKGANLLIFRCQSHRRRPHSITSRKALHRNRHLAKSLSQFRSLLPGPINYSKSL